MRTTVRIALIAGLAWGLAARAEDRRPLILVHTMTWFASKPVSGAWGWHWTMGRLDPEKLDASGRRAIAAHDDPEIGPYDSSDPDVLEYHALLMKVAGVDGAIADWYGNEDFNDYATIHRNTGALFDALGKHGLKFAVCYEDRAIKAMAEKKAMTPAQAVEHGRAHLRYCEANWFGRPGYAKWEGKPLLLVFGPDYLAPAQWEDVFAGLKSPSGVLHAPRAQAPGDWQLRLASDVAIEGRRARPEGPRRLPRPIREAAGREDRRRLAGLP